MANNLDAAIKLLYPVDGGTSHTADTVKLGDPFDIVASIEVGEDLMKVIDDDALHVSVRNLSQSTTITQLDKARTLVPQTTALNEEVRVGVVGGWNAKANVGDLLEAVASYRVNAGVFTDFSTATSRSFVVTN